MVELGWVVFGLVMFLVGYYARWQEFQDALQVLADYDEEMRKRDRERWQRG